MDDDTSYIDLEALRRRVTWLLTSSRNSEREPLRVLLTKFRDNGLRGYLFGGALRDLALPKETYAPRDLDIVIHDNDFDIVEQLVEEHLLRYSRFGGLVVSVEGWRLDLWRLSDTWAFKEGLVSEPAFENLPETTFLTINAGVASLSVEKGKPRKIYAEGMLESLRRQRIGINLQQNPYPGLCAVRSLVAAYRTGFSLSSELCRYVVEVWRSSGLDELYDTSIDHYGHAVVSTSQLEQWIHYIEDRLASSASGCMSLPKYESGNLFAAE